VKVWIYKGDIEPVINRPQIDGRPEIVADAPLAAAEAPAAVAPVVDVPAPTAPAAAPPAASE
jgi:hypothetical protein